MATRVTDINFNEFDTLKRSNQIWYFAKMFFSFFELNPPKPMRQKKGTKISFNKNLLITRLLLCVGLLTEKEEKDLKDQKNLSESEDTLNGFIKQYKNSRIDWVNSRYL